MSRVVPYWAQTYQPQLVLTQAQNLNLNWSDFPDFWISNLDVDPIPEPLADSCWLWPLKMGATTSSPIVCTDYGRDRLHHHLWERHNKRHVPKGRKLTRICAMRGCCNPTHWMLAATIAERAARETAIEDGRAPGPEQTSVIEQNSFVSAEGAQLLARMVDNFEPQPRTKAELISRVVVTGLFTEGEVESLFETLPSKERYP